VISGQRYSLYLHFNFNLNLTLDSSYESNQDVLEEEEFGEVGVDSIDNPESLESSTDQEALVNGLFYSLYLKSIYRLYYVRRCGSLIRNLPGCRWWKF